MRYRSTRGDPTRPDFESILLEGLAPDGGLYVPERWPELNVEATYPETVAATLRAFAPESEIDFASVAVDAFAGFRHEEVLPIRDLGGGHHLLELFWGPTLAFKDHALQVLGRLFDQVLGRHDRHLTVLGATSGDTGAAAIEACRGRDNLDVIILYPHNRVSEFQRRQMTTVPDDNVMALAVDGTFDDCQGLVKKAFSDSSTRDKLLAINSINFARIAVQVGYYLWAASRFHEPIDIAVPTGNFGNVFSGWAARAGGAEIDRLVIANNQNHGVAGLFSTGTLTLEPVKATTSPSMDIALPSNLERYLFELSDRDPEQVLAWQAALADSGNLALNFDDRQRLGSDFVAGWSTDVEVMSATADVYEKTGMILDPHTAVAFKVAREHKQNRPMLTLATADPAKFSTAVVEAIGIEPSLPPGALRVMTDPERITRLPVDYKALVKLLPG